MKPMIEEQLHVEEELRRKSQQQSSSEGEGPEAQGMGEGVEEEHEEEVKEVIPPKKKLPPVLLNLLSKFVQTVETRRQFVVTSATSALVLMILFEFKLVSLVLCLLLVTAQVPDNDFMKSLKEYLPHTQHKTIVVKKNKSSTPAAASRAKGTSSKASAGAGAMVPQANFSGIWKRGKLVNFEEFAAAQGASYVQRKLASSMTMIHTLTMDPELTVIRIQEKGGPISNDALLVIGSGEGVEVPMGPKLYLDSAVWDAPDTLRVTRLALPARDHELIMVRRLESNGQVIRQDQTYHNFTTGVRVEATSYFDLQGPSPNPLPASVHLETAASVAGGEGEDGVEMKGDEQQLQQETPVAVASSDRRDLSGVWVRTRTHNVDSYVGAQGAGFVQRKLAVSVAMTHTITMNPPDLTAFRLQEKGGPLDSDITYTANTMPMATQIMKRNFKDTLHWLPGSGTDGSPPTLVVTRVHEDNDFTLVHKRYIDEDDASGEPTLVLVAKHVDHATGTETVGTSWYKYSGPSPNPPPQPSGQPMPPSAPVSTAATTPPPAPAAAPSATVASSSLATSAIPPISESAENDLSVSESSQPTAATQAITAQAKTAEVPRPESGGMPKRMLSMSLK
jgi:hypothetical protein